MAVWIVTPTEKAQFSGALVYKYDENGILIGFENQTDLKPDSIQWFANKLPVLENLLPELIQRSNGKLRYIMQPEDMSFNRFWELYDVKKGSKYDAEKYWNGFKTTVKGKITNGDKVAIMRIIPRMQADYSKRGLSLPYPTTLLHQRRWENEF